VVTVILAMVASTKEVRELPKFVTTTTG